MYNNKKTGNETAFYEIDPAGGEALAAFTLPFPVGKLEQMEDGVRAIQQGEAIKVVLKPWMDVK